MVFERRRVSGAFWIVDIVDDRRIRTLLGDGSMEPASLREVQLIDRTDDESESNWAARVAEQLPSGQAGIVCVPPTQTHLLVWNHAVIDDPSTGPATNEMIRYAVESELPVDAESIELDHFRDETRTLALVTQHRTTSVIIDAIEQRGCAVERVIGRALFLAESLVRIGDVDELEDDSDKSLGAAVWMERPDSMNVDLVVIDKHTPFRWAVVPGDEESVREEMQLLLADGLGRSVIWCGADRALAEVLPPGAVMLQEDLDARLVSESASRLRRGWSSWFDLRRGRFASAAPYRHLETPLRRLAFVGLLAASLIVIFVQWRAWRFDSLAEKARLSVTSVFRETFPGQRVPALVVRRIKSEHAQALGQRASGDDAVEPSRPAIPVLQGLVQSIPSDMSVVVDRIRIEDGSFTLDVRLKEYEEAGQLASALAAAGFEIQPPSVTRTSGRLQVRLTGARRDTERIKP
ncbi:MAG: hypothetical protein AAGJ40_02115 [Planctomycetota bacterium]